MWRGARGIWMGFTFAVASLAGLAPGAAEKVTIEGKSFIARMGPAADARNHPPRRKIEAGARIRRPDGRANAGAFLDV